MEFKQALRQFMINDLKRGVPTFDMVSFSQNFGYELSEFSEKTKHIDLPGLWDDALKEAQAQLRNELEHAKERNQAIRKSLSRLVYKIPFLFTNRKQKWLTEQKGAIDVIEDRTYSLDNSKNYHEDLKEQIIDFHERNTIGG